MADIFGWVIQKKADYQREVAQTVDALIKKARPVRGWGNSSVKTSEVLFPTAMLGELYDWSDYNDTYRTIKYAIQRELFRNGAEWKPNFVSKCSSCSKEYKSKIGECSCGGKTFEPDEKQRERFEKFIKKANGNGHSLLEVYEQCEPDLEVLDNAYILAIKKYSFNDRGEIVGGEVIEIIRADPLYMRKIIDRQGRMGYDFNTSNLVLVCPVHRSYPQSSEICSECGKKTYPAHFRTWNVDSQAYYVAGECIHLTKYTKTLFYGFPPAITILPKVQTLMAMDELMKRYYYGQKMPKGLAAVSTNNVASMEKEWEVFLDRAKKDPYGIYPMFIPNDGKGSSELVKYIDFARSCEEMQYIETRTELKQTIGAFFGVMPIFQGDLSTSAGLNNEGLTITVTTRAIESGQKVFNEVATPFLLRQFGVEDWNYVIKPPEERDQIAELQREAQEIANAQAMQSLGFNIERTPDGKFKYSDKPLKQEVQSQTPPSAAHGLPASRLDGTPDAPTS